MIWSVNRPATMMPDRARTVPGPCPDRAPDRASEHGRRRFALVYDSVYDILIFWTRVKVEIINWVRVMNSEF